MVVRSSWINRAALVAALVLSGVALPVRVLADESVLQPAFLLADASVEAANDALPEAPDFDDIPFFARSDSGAYLRVDAGFGALRVGKAVTENERLNPTVTSGSFIVGAGLGYKLGYILRGDITTEYRSRARIRMANGVHAHVAGANVLANLYTDIGTWYGLTPYIGIGAGIGWSQFSRPGIFGGDQAQATFVWALSGGFAVDMAPAMTIDVGYRYIGTGASRLSGLSVKESSSHDVRIGLRWKFGALNDIIN